MRGWRSSRDERGQSEILGTVLVFSLVILVGTALVGVGILLFDDASNEFNDRQGQDAMQEIHDRLLDVRAGNLLEIPDGARENIEMLPDEGTVTVNVTTLERGVNITTEDGNTEWRNITADDILADNMTNERSFDVGTLEHEAESGTVTVYQGGMLFEQEGDTTRILGEPRFDFRSFGETELASIDLSFTSLSDLSPFLGAETFVARDELASRDLSAEIEDMVRKQRTLDGVSDFTPTTSIDITVTVETEYPETWKQYVTQRMTDPLREDQVMVRDGEVEIQFPTFGGEDLDVPDYPPEVIYSGVSGIASLFYDPSAGANVSRLDSGFTLLDSEDGSPISVTDGEYGIAIAEGNEWIIFNGSGGWTDVGGTRTWAFDEPADIDGGASDIGGGQDEWAFEDSATVCLVVDENGPSVDSLSTEQVQRLVAEGACSDITVGDINPPEQAPELAVTSLEGPDEQITLGDPITLTAEIDNVGDGYANESFVGAAADLGGEELDIVAADQISIYPSDPPKEVQLQFPATDQFNPAEPVEVFTLHDTNETIVDVEDAPFFHVNETQALDAGALPGEPFNVSANITNTGANATQTVALVDNGDVVDTERLELATNESGTVNLTWNVPVDASIGPDTELTVETVNDNATIDVSRLPEALITDVTVGTTTPNATEVPVTVTLENPSATVDMENATVRIDTDQSDLLQSQGNVTSDETIGAGESVTRTYYLSQHANPITDWVPVATDDDSAEGVGIVERDGPACGEVSYAGDGSEGSPYRISNVDELQCIQTFGLYQNDDNKFEIVDDIAAHGTVHWNGGDGFEPIGPEGNNYPNDFTSSSVGDAFQGDFDGGYHEIASLYINRPSERFVGLFGATADTGTTGPEAGALIQNVVITGADVHGRQHVGILAGQVGGVVQDSRTEGRVEAEEQLVGGIAGDGIDADLDNRLVAEVTVVGGAMNPEDDADDGNLNHEGIGGLVGRSSGETRISTGYALVDVKGDRYVGGITGTSSYVDSEFEQMYSVSTTEADSPTMDCGWYGCYEVDGEYEEGAIVGSVLSDGDIFAESLFWNSEDPYEDDAYGVLGNEHQNVDSTGQTDWQSRVTDQMQGPSVLPDPDDGHDFSQYEGIDNAEEFFAQYPGVEPEDAEGHMAELDWDIWEPVYETEIDPETGGISFVNESYPIFEWQSDGFVLVDIDDVSPDPLEPGAVDDERDLTVNVTVENTGDGQQQQTITLQDPRQEQTSVVDSETVTLAPSETRTLTLTWETSRAERLNENQTGTVIVSSDDDAATSEVQLLPFVDTALDIENLTVPDSIEALTGSLELEGGQNGTNFTMTADGAPLTEQDAAALEGEAIALLANGNIVDVVFINESLANDLANDPETTITLSWIPTLVDVGSADLEVQVLGAPKSDDAETEVVSPAEAFVPGDTLPVDVNLDLLTGG